MSLEEFSDSDNVPASWFNEASRRADAGSKQADAVVYKEGDTIHAISQDGTELNSGAAGTSVSSPGQDAAVIQSALDNESHVHVASGDYYLDAALLVSQTRARVSGSGWSTRLHTAPVSSFSTANSDGHLWTIDVDDSSPPNKMVVEDLAIFGQGADSTGVKGIHPGPGVDGGRVENVYLETTGDGGGAGAEAAIDVSTGQGRFDIEACHLVENYHGILITNASNEGCRVTNCYVDGNASGPGHDATFGIALQNGANHVVANNVVRDCQINVRVNSATHSLISGNLCVNAHQFYGINVLTGGTATHLVGNTSRECDGAGMRVAADDCHIDGALLVNNGQNSARTNPESAGLFLTGDNITATSIRAFDTQSPPTQSYPLYMNGTDNPFVAIVRSRGHAISDEWGSNNATNHNVQQVTQDSTVLRYNGPVAARDQLTDNPSLTSAGPNGEGGVSVGGDTVLYRQTADTWRTRDLLQTEAGFDLVDSTGDLGQLRPAGLTDDQTYTFPDRTGTIQVPLTGSATFDPASLADGAATSTTITVTGASTGDEVLATHDGLGANDVVVTGHVQAADTVRVVIVNQTGGALDIGSGTVSVKVFP